MKCKTCAAYAPGQISSTHGVCRLRAPVAQIVNLPPQPPIAPSPVMFIGKQNGQMQPQQPQAPQQTVQGFFPPVHEDIWCLEYRQRPQATERPQPAAASPSS